MEAQRFLYTGTRVVMAAEMDEDCAIRNGYACNNIDGHELRKGYHVNYASGCSPIVDMWIPKNEFESSYRRCSTFLDRLHIEKDDLYEKYGKLHNFINSDRFDELDKAKQNLLLAQYGIMKAYISILEQRIALEEKL